MLPLFFTSCELKHTKRKLRKNFTFAENSRALPKYGGRIRAEERRAAKSACNDESCKSAKLTVGSSGKGVLFSSLPHASCNLLPS